MSPAGPYRARLDYRDPIDLGDEVELAGFRGGAGERLLAFEVGGRAKAVASVEPLPG